MDANTIRIILFLIGLLVIVAIYWLDRSRKRRAPIQAVPRRRAARSSKREEHPPSELSVEEDSLLNDLATETHRAPLSEEELRAAAPVTPAVSPPDGGSVQPPNDQLALELEDEPTEEDLLSVADNPDLPTLIVQIHIMARDGNEFQGDQIFAAVRDVGLEFGDMDIFHRLYHAPRGTKTLFSMASLVEPGTFDPEHIETFSTPGLVLFTQLPVAKDGLAVFSDMLFTAERLAAALDGELYDETHSRLSKQTIAHVRDQILEHRRQVQLATSA